MYTLRLLGTAMIEGAYAEKPGLIYVRHDRSIAPLHAPPRLVRITQAMKLSD